jgi:hypothetical protein
VGGLGVLAIFTSVASVVAVIPISPRGAQSCATPLFYPFAGGAQAIAPEPQGFARLLPRGRIARLIWLQESPLGGGK